MTADNDYFIACRFEEPCPSVEAYRGKHAVKSQAFFEEVRAQQTAKMPPDWDYRPLKIEVETTDGCNQGCKHCGMSSRPIKDCSYLPREILLSLPDQLHSLGIPGISITGGEPFAALPQLLDLLSECRGKVDVVKLTTNAYWANTLESAKSNLRLLADRGLVDSSLFRPVLMLSIGEQKVPLQNIVNAVVAAQRLFDDRTLAVCISSLSLCSGDDRIPELERSYQIAVGKNLDWDTVFLTKRTYIAAGRALLDKDLPRREIPIHKMIKERGCFRQTVGAVVVPTPLIKVDGNVFTCSVFGMPRELLLGNIQEMTLFELLTAANENSIVRTILRGSLPALGQQVPDHKLDGVVADNFHEACWRLISLHQNSGSECSCSSSS